MKRVLVGIIILIWIGLLVGIMFSSLMYRFGTFLVLDEEAPKVEVAVTSWVSDKVIRCYQSGRCKKVFIVQNQSESNNWKAISRLGIESNLREQALNSGIKESDFYIFPRDGNQTNNFQFIHDILREKGVKSALVLTNYYKTRRCRFYLDRYGGEQKLKLYIQPLNDQYVSNFDHWWEHTAFANYFLSEYIRMAYYYFNKFFWIGFLKLG